MGLQGYNAKIKSRVPFSKKEEVFSLTLCLWQANFFSRKVAKVQRRQACGRQVAKGSIFSLRLCVFARFFFTPSLPAVGRPAYRREAAKLYNLSQILGLIC
jgi:hypothetical protein